MRILVIIAAVAAVLVMGSHASLAGPKCRKGRHLVVERVADRLEHDGVVVRLRRTKLRLCGVELGIAPLPHTVASCRRGAVWDGEFEVRSRSGASLASGVCHKNEADGRWRWSGGLSSGRWIRHYDNGVLHGSSEHWDTGGGLRESGSYDRGHRVGRWTFCYGNNTCRVEDFGLSLRSREPVF